MASLRAAVATVRLDRGTWVEAATARCKPALSEAEATAYWHVFSVLQQSILGSIGDTMDIRIVGIILMCQVFCPHRIRVSGSTNELWPGLSQERMPGTSSPR